MNSQDDIMRKLKGSFGAVSAQTNAMDAVNKALQSIQPFRNMIPKKTYELWQKSEGVNGMIPKTFLDAVISNPGLQVKNNTISTLTLAASKTNNFVTPLDELVRNIQANPPSTFDTFTDVFSKVQLLVSSQLGIVKVMEPITSNVNLDIINKISGFKTFSYLNEELLDVNVDGITSEEINTVFENHGELINSIAGNINDVDGSFDIAEGMTRLKQSIAEGLPVNNRYLVILNYVMTVILTLAGLYEAYTFAFPDSSVPDAIEVTQKMVKEGNETANKNENYNLEILKNQKSEAERDIRIEKKLDVTLENQEQILKNKEELELYKTKCKQYQHTIDSLRNVVNEFNSSDSTNRVY